MVVGSSVEVEHETVVVDETMSVIVVAFRQWAETPAAAARKAMVWAVFIVRVVVISNDCCDREMGEEERGLRMLDWVNDCL